MRASDDKPLAAPSLLLHGLAGRELVLQTMPPGADDGPAPRPILTASHLLLPQALITACDGTTSGVLLAATAHASAHLLHSPPSRASSALKPMGLAVVSAVEDARVEALLIASLPGVRKWFLENLRRSVQPDSLSFSALVSRMSLALLDDAYQDGNHWVGKARTLFADARRRHGLTDYAAFRRLASILANDLGQMRVRFDLQQYAVPAPYRDDNSYLWAHEASPCAEPEPLPLQVTQSAAAGQAGDAGAQQPSPSDVATQRHFYPEWDYRSAVLRQAWCQVIERTPARPDPMPSAALDSAGGTLLRLAGPQRLSRSRRVRRQREGEDIDIDAAIEAEVARRLRLAPEERVFMHPGRGRPTLSVLLLLDFSQSTAERSPHTSTSMLAMEKQAALLLARSALASGDRIAIHGFFSNTRAEVNYLRLLDFDDALDARCADLILSMPAAFSTRLGAALRHATELLANDRAAQRAVIVLTDGAPADVDVFDGHYLVEDARAAVQAASGRSVSVLGLAVDSGAETYARKIFGPRNFRTADSVAQLPRQLVDLYTQITIRSGSR